MKLNLPKGYLSHSQVDLWLRNKVDYRKRYYEGRSMYITPELEFGKKIAEEYEALHGNSEVQVSNPILRNVPRGTVPEFELKCEVRGIPVLGFIDSFDEGPLKIHELKTGKTPWTQSRVDRHPQLKMYCSGIRALKGEYNPYVNLHWIETRNVAVPEYIDGVQVSGKKIELTGSIVSFQTIVQYNDVEQYEKMLEQVAKEISDDYTTWSRLHPAPVITEVDEYGVIEIDGVRIQTTDQGSEVHQQT